MSDLPFTLDQLRILKAIAAEGSFKRAADSLYVSQPAVSLQVQNLERQLDVPLFDRGGRRAQLTEAGHLLLSYGDRILSLCQETCRAIEDLQNLQGGTLIVGASQTTGTYLLPRMIGMFGETIQMWLCSSMFTPPGGPPGVWPMGRSIWPSLGEKCLLNCRIL